MAELPTTLDREGLVAVIRRWLEVDWGAYASAEQLDELATLYLDCLYRALASAAGLRDEVVFAMVEEMLALARLRQLESSTERSLGRSQPAEDDLVRAQQRLRELPLQEIPEPALLPPGSRIVLSGNLAFVGRVADLRELARVLKDGQTAAIGQTAVASGMGGIGKTQLASEFVHRYGQFFAGGVYWLSFANQDAIAAEIAICGGRTTMDLPNFEGLALEQQVAAVRAAWESPLPRLLVLDNCEDPRLLTQWRPRTGGCRILVTARNAHWEDPSLGVRQVRLGTLARPESIDLLRKFRPDLAAEDPALWAIAEELGDLPLALHLAGSYLLEVGISPTDFLRDIRATEPLRHAAFIGEEPSWSPTDHERHVGRTFQLSFGRLRPDDPIDRIALALLARAACFAPGEPIPRDLLVATLRPVDEGPNTAALRALGRLVSLGLVEPEQSGALRLHRLLAAFVQAGSADEDAQAAVEQTIAETARGLNQAGFPLALLPLQPHLRFVESAAAARVSPQAGPLANELGHHLQAHGDLAGARPYLERALGIHERVLGPEHPDTAASLNNLGHLLRAQGDLAGARPYLERAATIAERVLGPDHPDTATGLSNLAGLLRDQKDLAGARSYLERVVAIREKILDPDHPDIARGLNNLGGVLQAQGDLTGARPYLERALAITEKSLGPNHPETASSLNNLAGLLRAQDDLAGARPYLERALAIRENVLDPNHPDTGSSLNNLGRLLRDQGNLVEARPYLERALAIVEKALGPYHPNTATSLHNLGHLLRDQGDLVGARRCYEREQVIRQHIERQEHQPTAATRDHFGVILDPRSTDRFAGRPPMTAPGVTKPGRNKPCWCGSGMKYKRCHLDLDQSRSQA